MPPDEPTKRVDMLNVEDIAAQVASDGDVKFCRCWKSKTFPLCDNAHLEHNEATGDNAAPMVLKGFDPILKSLANNYAVPS